MNFKDIPIGIDLGTTNSCIGAFINGIVEIIPNQILERTTPSIVSFCGKEISIGEQTKNKIFNDSEKVIYSIKTIIGKKYNSPDFNKLIFNLAYKKKIKPDANNRPLIDVNFKGTSYYPEEISAMILKKLKQNAELYLNRKIKKVVITIPAYFTENQREATKIAGEGAGLEVIKIINEPTAAALAYGLGVKSDIKRSEEDDNFFLSNKQAPPEENFDEKKILVFDLGGGTLDVTCLKIIKDDNGPQFEILGHSGNVHLGGDEFDDILVKYCIQNFKQQYKIDINTRSGEDIQARKRIKIACERAKQILSFEQETRISIESLYNDKDLQLNITRAKFEELSKEKFKEMIIPVEKALDCSGLEKEDIEEIILVGGSTRIPKVEEKLLEFFGGNKKICKSINPDEVVAYGATIQAAISMNEEAVNDVLINDVCSHSLGISIMRGNEKDIFHKLIENGTNIPYEFENIFTTTYDNQKSVAIEIFEGENEFCRNNRLLGKFILQNITKAKKGIPKIKVKIQIDEDSIVHVTAREDISGVTNSIDIKSDKGTMQDEEIKKMKKKLERKEDFEEIHINQKEKELTEEKKLLIQDYKNNRSLSTLKELEKILEKLIEISIDEYNKNNIDKKFKNVKALFNLYNYFFITYFDEYKNLTNNYLTKIKQYMELFKNDEAYYLKRLVLIFKDDKYENRIFEIVYHCINLYFEYINNSKNKKISSSYYNDALDLIKIFKEKIKTSNLENKLISIEKKCKIEKDKIIIENEEKDKNTMKNLTNDEAMSAIDQYTYIIEEIGSPNETTSKREKVLRAYILQKLVYLEFNVLKYKDLKKLKDMAEEALSLCDQCNLTKETDSWVGNLLDMKNNISKKLEEKEKNECNEINRTLSQIMIKEIDGNDDEENIEFLKLFDNELIKGDDNKGNIEKLYYDTNAEKLINKRLAVINKIPEQKVEIKEKKNWVKKILNKIKNIFKTNNKKGKKKKK